MFKEVYALEKIHGTSCHITFKENDTFKENKLHFFSGGENHENFLKLFNQEELLNKFIALGHPDVTVYGEGYGGSQQGMSYLYGKQLKFIAFEVKCGEYWLSVPNAEDVVKKLELEFVHYIKIPATIEMLDKERDSDSVQAVRNGVDLTNLPKNKTAVREGIVIRPLIELTKNDGGRIIVKHKNKKFSERLSTPKVYDETALKVLQDAEEIAKEWVTYERLKNILSHLKEEEIDISNIPNIIKLMLEDVTREGSGEIVNNKESRKVISKHAVILFKQYLKEKFDEANKTASV